MKKTFLFIAFFTALIFYSDADLAWFVDFSGAGVSNTDKSSPAQFRCVRKLP
ncbi:hypothetical protein J6Z19_05915 [bacterium]|nr:hypothetical protein [bacterium]